MRTLESLDLSEKTVLLQMSLDVPMQDGAVTDDTRLRASVPTIEYLLDNECTIIICGHMGRPKGADPSLSTKPVALALEQLLGRPVHHLGAVIGEDVKTAVSDLEPMDVAMLENTRYHDGEQGADPDFASEVAALAECFVSDDYPSAHRAYAINTLVAKMLPSAAGLSMQQEVRTIKKAVADPEQPLLVIIGGAKADKIGVVDNMIGTADHVIVGGVLANTFLKASGVNVAKSKYDEQSTEIAGEYLRDAEEKFLLPTDAVAAEAFAEDAEHTTCDIQDIPEGWMVLDIGPETIKRYARAIRDAKTVIWGGPIGVYEWEAFSHGTRAVAEAVSESSAYSLVAGGDSGDAVRAFGLADGISHVSIGGGATLALIAGEELPAIQALM